MCLLPLVVVHLHTTSPQRSVPGPQHKLLLILFAIGCRAKNTSSTLLGAKRAELGGEWGQETHMVQARLQLIKASIGVVDNSDVVVVLLHTTSPQRGVLSPQHKLLLVLFARGCRARSIRSPLLRAKHAELWAEWG